MRRRFRNLWLAVTVAFLLSLQYIERYSDEKNRMLFHWSRWDGLAIVFSVFLLGLLLFLAWLLITRLKDKRIGESAFILLLGVALIKDIEWWIFKSADYGPGLEAGLKGLIYLLFAALIYALGVQFFGKNKKISKFFIKLCLILSPVIPVFLIGSFTYKTWAAKQGELPLHSPAVNEKAAVPDTFIFFFDEWSYKRSFKDKELLPIFENLRRFEQSAVSFNQGLSPACSTFQSMPKFIFQNRAEFRMEKGRLLFVQEAGETELGSWESIFTRPHQEGYFTTLVGTYLPYAELAGRDVDFIKSFSVYRMFGNNFLGTSLYHFLKSVFLCAFRFCPPAVKWAEEVCANQYQYRMNAQIHRQTLAVIRNVRRPVFGLFFYNLPHKPYIYSADGAGDIFKVYKADAHNYAGNLAYLDKIIGEIISTLRQSDRFENSLIVMSSDHSWRHDPDLPADAECSRQKRHVPLFVKFPGQKKGYRTSRELDTAELFEFIAENY